MRSSSSQRLLLVASLFASLAAAVASCGSRANPPGLTAATGTTSGGSGGAGGDELLGTGGMTAPKPDAGDLCGQLITQVEKDPPNIYFVLDTSGSMATPVGASTRYRLVQGAAFELVKSIGGLINVGVALFPAGVTQATQCHAGAEVLPVMSGDALDLDKFTQVTNVQPLGGTPTAATLEALYPTLTALPGRTIVVLATDGGPNCNASAACGAEDCMDNIEGACYQGKCCTLNGPSCCADSANQGPLNCIDRKASIAAVKKLADAGVRVYVVGVPGSETYGSVLDQMALVSGAPQIAPPFYYKVEDYTSLAGTLGAIAALEVSCRFDLVTPPSNPSLVNVYLDDTVVPQDLASGWAWELVYNSGPVHAIELHGDACHQLKSGKVKQVQIAVGCPTVAAN